MIRLGLRLTLNGGKEAAARLVITAAAVALGVGLLLMALSGLNGLNAQNARTAWLNTSEFNGPGPGLAGAPGLAGSAITHGGVAPTTTDPLWWLFSTDHFGSGTIDRVDVAATGPHSPVPPGLAHLPGPGQFYASPALARLLAATPAAELADRFPGRQIGTIGPSALPSPNSLIIVIGRTVSQLSSQPDASHVTSINTGTGHSGGSNGWDDNKLQVILAVGALALLFPVLIFIATATRLAAARREQRFAAMRLVGATPRQVAMISAVEASVAALGGVAVGFGVFFLLRPLLTSLPLTGQPFAPGDLSLGLTDILLVVIGVPLAAAASARFALRRVHISPLGVSRRVTPAAPRAYRLLPLVAGLAELFYFVVVGRPNSTGGQIEAYFSGCLLVMAGLVIAGPWLTMVGARIMARRAGRPAVLIAGRRLSDNPRGAFRAISGLILALFATSVSVGVITTMLDYQSASSGTAATATLLQEVGPDSPQVTAPGQAVTPPAAVPAALPARLRSIRGVQGVTVIYDDRSVTPIGPGGFTVLALCSQVAHNPALGHCPSGAAVVAITGDLASGNLTGAPGNKTLAGTVWPAAPISPQRLAAFPVQALVVGTNGSGAAVERARTALDIALPDQSPAETLGEISEQNLRLITELQHMTDVVILVSLVIAGCSLAVSVTAGVTDRKRPFSLLRLTGVPLRVLRGVVALEAAVPLLVIAVLSVAMGFMAAALFLTSQLGEALQPPGLAFYLIVGAGLVASLAIIASTMPLIERITGPETARNE